ncbi:pirin family protein, partial [Nonlabens antarcticus]|uniref:pirin family protein n=1 Tax=Nonlabens antarcticus TaxID=392714 RepID=UPI001890F01F
MKTTIHKAESRGQADHGWLKANHSFSFASWHNPSRMNFGALRVLNDDTVAAGAGFPTHPHANMEIITIPLSGTLEHKDSMGNTAQIKTGEIQVMSAGTGVTHSEYNASSTEELKLFQIWLFPNKQNVTPRYDELKLNPKDRHNKFQQILSPTPEDAGVWIHQEAWLHMISMDQHTEQEYNLKSQDNGVYIMVVEGAIEINDTTLSYRDAIAI